MLSTVSPLRGPDSPLYRLSDQLRDARLQISEAHYAMLSAAHCANQDGFSHARDYGAWLLCALGFVLLLLEASGAACMLRARDLARRCSVNGLGVQAAGCGWVLHTLLIVISMICGSVFLAASAGLHDVGAVLLKLPYDPYPVLGPQVCNISTQAAGQGSGEGRTIDINACSVLQQCFARPSTPIFAQVRDSLDDLDGLDEASLTALLGNATARSTVDISALDHALWEAQQARQNSTSLSAANFGVPNGTAFGTELDAQLDVLRNSTALALDALTPLVALAARLANASTEVTHAARPLLNAFSELDTSTDCSWAAPAWDGTSHAAVLVAKNMNSLALMLLVGSLGGLYLVAALIRFQVSQRSRKVRWGEVGQHEVGSRWGSGPGVSLRAIDVAGHAPCERHGPCRLPQIYFGGVGNEPGCPSCCRCCCPAGGGRFE